jgi:hypothetical protein
MIKGLSGSQGVLVGGGNTALPYIPPNPSNPVQGMLRVSNTELEVFNGSSWQMIPSSYASITLDPDVQQLIEWARKKRSEDLECESLAKENSTINDLVNQIKEKQHQVKMIATLIKKEVTV